MNFRKTIPGSPASQTQCEHHRVEKTPILTRYFSLQPGILFRSTWVTWCPWHIMISYYPNGFNNSGQMWKTKGCRIVWFKYDIIFTYLHLTGAMVPTTPLVSLKPDHGLLAWHLMTFVLVSSNFKQFQRILNLLLFCTSEHEETDSKSV